MEACIYQVLCIVFFMSETLLKNPQHTSPSLLKLQRYAGLILSITLRPTQTRWNLNYPLQLLYRQVLPRKTQSFLVAHTPVLARDAVLALLL